MHSLLFCFVLIASVSAPPPTPYAEIIGKIDQMIQQDGNKNVKEPGRSNIIKTLACYLGQTIIDPKSPFAPKDNLRWLDKLYVGSLQLRESYNKPTFLDTLYWTSLLSLSKISKKPDDSLTETSKILMGNIMDRVAYACGSEIKPLIMETYQTHLARLIQELEKVGFKNLDLESKFSDTAKLIDNLHKFTTVKDFLGKAKEILRSMSMVGTRMQDMVPDLLKHLDVLVQK